jgi:hypothetical protein
VGVESGGGEWGWRVRRPHRSTESSKLSNKLPHHHSILNSTTHHSNRAKQKQNITQHKPAKDSNTARTWVSLSIVQACIHRLPCACMLCHIISHAMHHALCVRRVVSCRVVSCHKARAEAEHKTKRVEEMSAEAALAAREKAKLTETMEKVQPPCLRLKP